MTMIERIAEHYGDDLLRFTGYDDCIIGVVSRINEGPAICYDYEKVVDKLTKELGSYEDAIEWISFNMAGAYVGKTTPYFLDRMTDVEADA